MRLSISYKKEESMNNLKNVVLIIILLTSSPCLSAIGKTHKPHIIAHKDHNSENVSVSLKEVCKRLEDPDVLFCMNLRPFDDSLENGT